MKMIISLLYYLNNNCGNFCSMWSNKVLISSQDNALSESDHIFYVDKLEKIRKKLYFQSLPHQNS